jgi:hypothetical protein
MNNAAPKGCFNEIAIEFHEITDQTGLTFCCIVQQSARQINVLDS